MTELIVLRLVHILGGIFWVGSGLFSVVFLTPVLMRAGPAAGPVMAGLQARKLFTVLPLVAILTIASGLRLIWIVSGGLGAAWFDTRMGEMLTASGAAAIVAFLLAMFVARPASLRAVQLSAAASAMSDEAERSRATSQIASLRARAGVAGHVVLALLLISAAGMSVARYLS